MPTAKAKGSIVDHLSSLERYNTPGGMDNNVKPDLYRNIDNTIAEFFFNEYISVNTANGKHLNCTEKLMDYMLQDRPNYAGMFSCSRGKDKTEIHLDGYKGEINITFTKNREEFKFNVQKDRVKGCSTHFVAIYEAGKIKIGKYENSYASPIVDEKSAEEEKKQLKEYIQKTANFFSEVIVEYENRCQKKNAQKAIREKQRKIRSQINMNGKYNEQVCSYGVEWNMYGYRDGKIKITAEKKYGIKKDRPYTIICKIERILENENYSKKPTKIKIIDMKNNGFIDISINIGGKIEIEKSQIISSIEGFEDDIKDICKKMSKYKIPKKIQDAIEKFKEINGVGIPNSGGRV